MASEGQSLADYAAKYSPTGARLGKVERLVPPELRDQIAAAARDDNAPGSRIIHRWLVEVHGFDVSRSAVDYYYQKVRHERPASGPDA